VGLRDSLSDSASFPLLPFFSPPVSINGKRFPGDRLDSVLLADS